MVRLWVAFAFFPLVSTPLWGANEDAYRAGHLSKLRSSAVSSRFVPQLGPGPVSAPIGHPIDRMASWMAKLEWVQVDPFYGAALPLWYSNGKLFFLHNFHELPSNRQTWGQLRARGKWGNFEPFRAYVAGIEPGLDLAVSYVNVPLHQHWDEDEVNKEIASLYFLGSLEREKWRVGVLGIPGPWRDARQVYGNLLWRLESYLLSVWKKPEEVIASRVPDLFAGSQDEIEMELRHDCPPVFMDVCYRVLFRIWGWSGGAFTVNQKDERQTPLIGGIPSFFIPLSAWTYVIPSSLAYERGQKMVLEYLEKVADGEENTLVEHTMHVSGMVEWKGRNEILVHKGPLSGATIAGVQNSVGGGGEASGGGGGEVFEGGGEASGGGGGEVFHGGGEASGGGGGVVFEGGGEASGGGGGPVIAGADFYFMSDTVGNVSGLASYSKLLDQIQRPHLWGRRGSLVGGLFRLMRGTKGVDAIFRYSQGIHVNGERILAIDDLPIRTLQDFVRLYTTRKSDKPLRMARDIVAVSPPRDLELTRDDHSGLYGDLNLLRFKPTHKLSSKVFDPNMAVVSGLNEPEIAALLLNTMWDGHVGETDVDAVSVREALCPGGSISAARFHVDEKGTTVSVVIPRYKQLDLSFGGERKLQPQPGTLFYTFNGPIHAKSTAFDSSGNAVESEMIYDGFSKMEWDPISSRWEMRIIMAAAVPAGRGHAADPDLPESALFSGEDEINFVVVSIPLRKVGEEGPQQLTVKPWEIRTMAQGKELLDKRLVEMKREFQVALAQAGKPAAKIRWSSEVQSDLEEQEADFRRYLAEVSGRLVPSLTDNSDGTRRQVIPKPLATAGNVGVSVSRISVETRLLEAEKKLGLSTGDLLTASVLSRGTVASLPARIQNLEYQVQRLSLQAQRNNEDWMAAAQFARDLFETIADSDSLEWILKNKSAAEFFLNMAKGSHAKPTNPSKSDPESGPRVQ